MDDNSKFKSALSLAIAALDRANKTGVFQSRQPEVSDAIDTVRRERLYRVFIEAHDTGWPTTKSEVERWEFPGLFGALVKLAEFDVHRMTYQEMSVLFTAYFGPNSLAYLPSVFIAASLQPGASLNGSQKQELLDLVERHDADKDKDGWADEEQESPQTQTSEDDS